MVRRAHVSRCRPHGGCSLIALANAHVVVGDGTDLDSACVVVKDGRISALLAEPPADAAVVVDLEGRALLPGLIDLHTHLVGGDKTLGFADEAVSFRLAEPLAKNVLDGVDAALVTLNAGFTTVRDVSARAFVDVFLRGAQQTGQIAGPRIRCTGPALAMTGGHGSELLVGQESDAPADMIKHVRWLVANGVDWIKVVSADGPETLGRWTTVQSTPEEIAAAFTEARRLGRPTMAHAMGPDAIANVVRAGGKTIEHGWYLTEDSCRLMIEHGATLVPTLGNVVDIVHKGPGLLMPWAEMMADDEDAIFARHRMAIEMGVKVALGSDVGGNEARLHGDNADELVHHVRCGMTPGQAIVSATLDAARVLGLESSLGSLEAGKIADLVIVDGDPLTDVGLVGSALVGVVQDGRVVRDDLGILGEMRTRTTLPRTRTSTAILPFGDGSAA